MQHLFQSTFLQALGYAIAYSIWQTAIVWLIYLSITGLLHRTSAAVKYRIGVVSQIISFCWFILTFQFYYRQYTHAWQTTGSVPAGQELRLLVSGNTDLSSRIIHWMIRGEQFLPYISLAYLLLIIFLSVRWVIGYRQTQQIRFRGLQKMPVTYRLFVTRIAEQLGISRKIQVYLSDVITTPLTIGFFRPVILVPLASINHLSTEQMEAVLLHELAHIRRYDYLINILLSVAEIGLFFNPFTQMISRQIKKERENSCDDWVLQYQYNATTYAEALLRIACLQATPALAMTATSKKNDLLIRVKRMIDKKENHFNYRKQLLAFVVVTGIVSSIAWLNPIQQPSNTTVTASRSIGKPVLNKKQPAYSVEPMAVSVDNPLFNPVFFLSKPLQAEMKKNIDKAQQEMTASLDTRSAKENTGDKNNWVTSITPLVASALEGASHVFDNVTTDMNIPAVELAKAKEEMYTSFRKDSLFITPAMQKQINTEISRSLQKTNLAIKQSQAAMIEVAKKTHELVNERAKVQKDIEQAMLEMKELKSMGLGKVISDALEQTGILFDQELKPSGLKTGFRLDLQENKKSGKQIPKNTRKHTTTLSVTDNKTDAEPETSLVITSSVNRLIADKPERSSDTTAWDIYIDPVASTLVINNIPMDLGRFVKLVNLRKEALREARKMKRIPVIRIDTFALKNKLTPLIIQLQ